MRVAGFSSIAGAVASLVIWAVHFAAVYMANAIACARGLAGRTLLGMPLVPVLILGATLLALAAIAVVGMGAARRLGGGLSGQEGEEEPQFTLWLTMSVSLLAALAILWESVPALVLRPCL